MRFKPVTSWDDVPVVMDLPFAARIVGQSPEYLRKRAQQGTFPAYKEGTSWRITKEALREHTKGRQLVGINSQ
jgi:excisionase family DNA binding protein